MWTENRGRKIRRLEVVGDNKYLVNRSLGAVNRSQGAAGGNSTHLLRDNLLTDHLRDYRFPLHDLALSGRIDSCSV